MASFPVEGGCDCRTVRYRMETAPLFVHCCHCRWCQRETGASFALNAMIETERVTLLAGQPEPVDTPSASGKGQKILRCPTCRIALWSHYSGAGPAVAFVRVGTLDDPDALPPDIHIYTDEPGAVYLYTGRGNYVLPDRYDSATALPRESFDENLKHMRDEILAGKAVLALFQGGEVDSPDAAIFKEGLYLAHKSSGDEIYSAHP